MAEPAEHDQLFTTREHEEVIHISPHSEKPSENITHRGWTTWLMIAGICTTFGASLPVGYNIGVVNSPADIIKSFCNNSLYQRYDVILSERELDVLWSAIVSIFLIGGVTGSLSGSYLADRVGRKGAYIISTLISIIAACLFYTSKLSNSFEMLLTGRLLAGLSAGLTTCVVPMYLTELAPLNLRGAMGVLCPLGVTFGVLFGQIMSLRQVLGTEDTWPDLLAFYAILVVCCSFLTPFLPESPKYLFVIKNQQQMALRELTKIRGLPSTNLTEEIENLALYEQNISENNVSWNLVTVLKNRQLLLPILLVCSMQAGQQCSGINAVFYYSVSIFKKAGLGELECQLATIGAGGVNAFMAIVAIPLMSRCNRRGLFLISCITATCCLIILGLSIYFIHSLSWMPYLSIITVLLYVFFYQIGLGPIPYFIGAELFEVGPRPSAMALGSMANWGGNFLVGMSFPTLQNFLGPGVFGLFASITLCLFFFVRKYLPETHGRDPTEVALLCKDGLSSQPFNKSSALVETSEVITSNDIKILN